MILDCSLESEERSLLKTVEIESGVIGDNPRLSAEGVRKGKNSLRKVDTGKFLRRMKK